MPDVIKLLEEDHREVESLFSKAKENSGAAKAQVVSKIAKELTIHSEVEESIVYPAMDWVPPRLVTIRKISRRMKVKCRRTGTPIRRNAPVDPCAAPLLVRSSVNPCLCS